MIADTAYGLSPMLGGLIDRKIASCIPVVGKVGRPDGTLTRIDFEWDEGNDHYICLEGRAKYRALKLTPPQVCHLG